MKTILFLCFIAITSISGSLNREKRFLIVPPTAPTRHQWIAGIGIPLDLENMAVTSGWVLKAQYFLPTKVDDLFPLGIWDDIERPKQKRDLRDKEVTLVDNSTGTEYTQYNVPAVVIEEGSNHNGSSSSERGFANTEYEDDEEEEEASDQVEKDSKAAQNYWNSLHDPDEGDENSQNSRWDAYKMLEGITNSRGMGGKHCVLRTICESAASPISHKSGILGELLHILLTPSSSMEKADSEATQEYVEAEKLGLQGDEGACQEHYPECRKSLMDVFTTFENPFETLFNTYL